LYCYNGERGRGFIDNGIEFDEFEAKSAFDTYLNGVDITQIKPIYKHIDTDTDDYDNIEIVVDDDNNDSRDCSHILNQSDLDNECFVDIDLEYDDFVNSIPYKCAEIVLV
jgi:hypothetical protein